MNGLGSFGGRSPVGDRVRLGPIGTGFSCEGLFLADRRKWVQDRDRGLDRATRDTDQVDGDQDTDEPQT